MHGLSGHSRQCSRRLVLWMLVLVSSVMEQSMCRMEELEYGLQDPENTKHSVEMCVQ